jgi:hypothetical protein
MPAARLSGRVAGGSTGPGPSPLRVVLAALQQWGDEHLPRLEGPSMLRRVAGTDRPVHIGCIDPTAGRSPPTASR